jgi:hypothetical protein
MNVDPAAFALLLHPRVFLVAAGVFVLLRALGSSPLGQVALYKRALPLMPELLCVAAMTLGAAPEPNAPILVNVLLGVWSSYVAIKFRKVLGQTVLGDDQVVEQSKAPKLAAAIRDSLAPTTPTAPAFLPELEPSDGPTVDLSPNAPAPERKDEP